MAERDPDLSPAPDVPLGTASTALPAPNQGEPELVLAASGEEAAAEAAERIREAAEQIAHHISSEASSRCSSSASSSLSPYLLFVARLKERR